MSRFTCSIDVSLRSADVFSFEFAIDVPPFSSYNNRWFFRIL